MLDQLVLDRALANEATKSNVVVPVDRLREFIANVPAFQQDGKFSYDRYKAFLASRGQSEAAFEQSLRNDLRKQTFVQAVVESAMTPKQVIERIERILLEQREVRELRFPRRAICCQSFGDGCADRRVLPGEPQRNSRFPRTCASSTSCFRRKRSAATSLSPKQACERLTTSKTRHATAPRNSGAPATY